MGGAGDGVRVLPARAREQCACVGTKHPSQHKESLLLLKGLLGLLQALPYTCSNLTGGMHLKPSDPQPHPIPGPFSDQNPPPPNNGSHEDSSPAEIAQGHVSYHKEKTLLLRARKAIMRKETQSLEMEGGEVSPRGADRPAPVPEFPWLFLHSLYIIQDHSQPCSLFLLSWFALGFCPCNQRILINTQP